MGQFDIIYVFRKRRQRLIEMLDKLLIEKGIYMTIEELEEQIRKKREKALKTFDQKYLYHWYEEPPRADIEVKSQKLKQLLKEAKEKLKAKNYYDLLKNKIKIAKTTTERIIKQLNEQPTVKMKVQTLLKICKKLNIEPKQLEKQKFFKIKFPINLRSPTIIKLKTHIINEGSISKRTTGTQCKAEYINKDPVLHHYVTQLLEKLGVNAKPYYKASKDIHGTNINATITRALIKAGLKPGKITQINPTLDPRINVDPKLRKYYFQATLTEEGSSTARIKGRRLIMEISWDRTIDVTDKLTPKQREMLKEIVIKACENKKEKTLSIKRLQEIISSYDDEEILQVLDVIRENTPRLLHQEVALLNRIHGKQLGGKSIASIYAMKIRLTEDNRFTVTWRAYIREPSAIDLIVKEYGMLPGTWKEWRLKKQYEIYQKHGEKTLSNEELQRIRRQLSLIPERITQEWIEKKLKEFWST